MDLSKIEGKKVGFTILFPDNTRRVGLPKNDSLHTAEITAIETTLKEITVEMLNNG